MRKLVAEDSNLCFRFLILKFAVLKKYFPFLLAKLAVDGIMLFIFILKNVETSSEAQRPPVNTGGRGADLPHLVRPPALILSS